MAIERAGKPLLVAFDRGDPWWTLARRPPPRSPPTVAARSRRTAAAPSLASLPPPPPPSPRPPPPPPSAASPSHPVAESGEHGRGRAGCGGRASDRLDCSAVAAPHRCAPYGSRIPAAACACHDAMRCRGQQCSAQRLPPRVDVRTDVRMDARMNARVAACMRGGELRLPSPLVPPPSHNGDGAQGGQPAHTVMSDSLGPCIV